MFGVRVVYNTRQAQSESFLIRRLSRSAVMGRIIIESLDRITQAKLLEVIWSSLTGN